MKRWRRWSSFYIVKFAKGKVAHALFTWWGPMGVFQLDQMFGGGMNIPCGKATSGKAVISPQTTNRKSKVTCKRCRKALEI